MSILKLAENLYVSPQLTETDAETAAKLGIKSVICNRPNREEENQPDAETVQQWLKNSGISAFYHQPVTAPAISQADVDAFHNLVRQAEPPVLAYCRTGTRCSLLWAYCQVQNGLNVDEAKQAAAQAGVDLSKFETRLNEAAEHGLA